jgi:hypothetical protein
MGDFGFMKDFSVWCYESSSPLFNLNFLYIMGSISSPISASLSALQRKYDTTFDVKIGLAG